MKKRHIVRLHDSQVEELERVISDSASSQELVRRARILLQVNADGPNWSDRQVAEHFGCRPQTVEILRRRFHEKGFEAALYRAKRKDPPRARILDQSQIERLLALKNEPPPLNYERWTVWLLASRAYALKITDQVSHETIRRVLKEQESQSLSTEKNGPGTNPGPQDHEYQKSDNESSY